MSALHYGGPHRADPPVLRLAQEPQGFELKAQVSDTRNRAWEE